MCIDWRVLWEKFVTALTLNGWGGQGEEGLTGCLMGNKQVISGCRDWFKSVVEILRVIFQISDFCIFINNQTLQQDLKKRRLV